MIPVKDAENATVTREDPNGGYALYKPAPQGWPKGFLVITKARKRAWRRIHHVWTEHEARIHVNNFFSK